MKGLPARLKQPARKWMRPVFVASALGLFGCSGTTDPGPVTVLPGATLPLDTTVRIDAVATYLRRIVQPDQRCDWCDERNVRPRSGRVRGRHGTLAAA